MRIPEEEMHKLRGDKIAMIFQDPMSSLNPIVKIGKQLTEAMILKGKARQRESRSNFNTYLKNLNAAGNTMLVLPGRDETVVRAANNIEKLQTSYVNTLNVYDILKAGKIILTQDALKGVEEVYA